MSQPLKVRIGNAPVSYGVYGAQAGGAGASPEQLLATMAAAGYEGSELGPPGFFGTPRETAASFEATGLTAIGAYVPLHLGLEERTAFERDLQRMRTTCEELQACGGGGVLVLADEGAPELLLHPARTAGESTLGLDEQGWDRLAQRLQEALELAKLYDLATAFHPHISTFVESPADVERVLAVDGVQLALDTGHIALAGGNPVECLRLWQERIAHVHIKDVRESVLTRAKLDGRADFDEWWGDVCVPLGQGDIDLATFLDELLRCSYSGWIVVEQDRRPTERAEYPGVAAEQRANLAWVRSHTGGRERHEMHVCRK